MGNRLSLAHVLLFFAWVPCVIPACRCSQEPEVLSYSEACEEIGYSLANRTVTCGESAERGNQAFEDFTASFSCKASDPAADAGADAGTFTSILDCAQAMLLVPCETLVGPNGSLGSALASAPACADALVPGVDAASENTCPSGQTRCGENCVELRTDNSHCGACGNACKEGQALNFSARCEDGACQYDCLNNRLDCDDDLSNGCEVDWMTDAKNCLGCGKVCPAPTQPGQEPRCQGATCVSVCDPTHLDCDGQSENGCEVTVGNANCYVCGADCTQGGLVIGTCSQDSHACVVQSNCPPGTLNCDDVQDCETTPGADHCGLCSVKCPAQANATAVCGDAGCSFECLAGFLDCNAVPTDGCEVEAAACP